MKSNLLKKLLVALFVLAIFSGATNLTFANAASDSIELDVEENADEVVTLSENDEYNIVSYDLTTGKKEFLYYEDSIWSSEKAESDYENDDEDISTASLGPIIGTSATAPYKFVCRVSNYGSAAFIGRNILLTAGHCVYNNVDGFIKNIVIYPGRNGTSTPYGYFNVKKVYIQKEYYLNCDKNFDYDWAIMVIDSSESTGTQPGGNFGKISNYSRTDEEICVYGYVKDYMQESHGNIKYYTDKRLEYDAETAGGISGGPVIVCRNTSQWYVIGIHTASNSTNTSWGGTRINSLIFLLTNSLLIENSIEIDNFYLNESGEYVAYNCVAKIVANPKPNTVIYTSTDGTNYSSRYSGFTEEFYTSGTNTVKIQTPFDYFKTLDKGTNRFSVVERLTTKYTVDENNARYATKVKSGSESVISTKFDDSGNVWSHGGSTSKIIKGTIVYGKHARNIEVSVPWIGTKTSSTVVIDGVSFQLRCGPNKVSIKASKSITCNSKNVFFAFGVA